MSDSYNPFSSIIDKSGGSFSRFEHKLTIADSSTIYFIEQKSDDGLVEYYQLHKSSDGGLNWVLINDSVIANNRFANGDVDMHFFNAYSLP